MIAHDPIFSTFNRQTRTASGTHVYDFLGVSTDVSFKKGWEQHAPRAGVEVVPSYPPLNEHYLDWIATLECVRRARGAFRMAELGAGWGPWLVRAAVAARQCAALQGIELVAVEADETHYRWLCQHFSENGIDEAPVRLMSGALAGRSGMIRFPKIDNPNEDYGASTRAVRAGVQYVEVPAITIEEVLSHFSGPLDFMHVDVQGAEYDALPPSMPLLERSVKAIMVGTHISDEHHQQLVEQFRDAGWLELMNYPRNAPSQTPYGEVNFGDGFLFFRNPAFG